MAYTLYDLAALLKLQGSLSSRVYDYAKSGTANNDFLYGDQAVFGSPSTSLLIRLNDRILAGAGDDALYGGVGNDSLSGDNGNDFLEGWNGDDLLMGGAGNDILHGGAGADFLNGGLGSDVMHGDLGYDTYVVDNVLDQVVEDLVDSSTSADVVLSSVSFVLGANLENLVLTGTAAINATGNELDNVLYGNSGTNTLAGLAGDDHYYVQNTSDIVIESSATKDLEWNIVFSSATFTLTPGSEIDEFILTGSSAVKAYGNEQVNLIEGNVGSNSIYGMAGDDTLSGVPLDVTLAADHSDWTFIVAHLNEDQGTDLLYGGAGNDMMFLGRTDRIVELLNEGIDTAVCGYSHVLEANVENLDFYGDLGSTDALRGTGNSLDNYIISNKGADTLIGKLGNDTYEVFNSAIVVTELASQGYDTVNAHVDFKLAKYVEDLVLMPVKGTFSPFLGYGNDLNNHIWGNEVSNALDGQGGNDTLYGGLGNDLLTGGVGVDHFVFDTALNATNNLDSIQDFRFGEDKIYLDQSVFSAFAPGNLNPGELVQGAAGGAAPAQTANEHLLFDTDSGTLFYDADGSGAGAATAFAILNPGPTGYVLASTDFLIV